MTSGEVAVVVGAALTLGALLAAAFLLKPSGRELLYVALPLLAGVVLALMVWGRVEA